MLQRSLARAEGPRGVRVSAFVLDQPQEVRVTATGATARALTELNERGGWLARLARNKILIDADPETKQRKLLQIFTQNAIGPIFFEIIQRKGNEGFGEGNFKALFESIELDQIRRGVI